MPVESPVNYISDLVSANPLHTDGVGTADSHIRLIKTAIKQTFPNINGPVSATPADLTTGVIPIGGIIIWSGSVSAIPTGWHLCDGTNGTPDLRSKFVYGASSDADKGASGGAATDNAITASSGSHTHSGSIASSGAHSHGGETGSHVLTAAEIPAHFHFGGATVLTQFGTAVEQFNAGNAPTDQPGLAESGGGGGLGHSHPISSDGAHTHSLNVFADGDHTHTVTVDTLPPYLTLAYIMRIA